MKKILVILFFGSCLVVLTRALLKNPTSLLFAKKSQQRLVASKVHFKTFKKSEDVISHFKDKGKKVLTFIGYSGAGYENKVEMLRIARSELEGLDPEEFIVNIGVTPDGIGQVYLLAKEMGFDTTGIVSTKAEKYLDRVEFVEQR